MPPRYAYWVIVLDGTATSFRARSREELLPTFNRLRAKDPGAVMRWFERGKLFDSPTLAREERLKEAGLWEDRDRGPGTGDRFRAKDRERFRTDDRRDGTRTGRDSGFGIRDSKDRNRGPGAGDQLRTKDRERFRTNDRRPKTGDRRDGTHTGRDSGFGIRDSKDRAGDQFRTKDRDARPGKASGFRPKGPDRPSSGQAGSRPTAKGFDRGPKGPSRPGPGRPPGRRPDQRSESASGEKRSGKPEQRGKDWRPGGEHRDPRDKYKGQPGERRKRWKERFFAKQRSGDAAKGPKKR